MSEDYQDLHVSIEILCDGREAGSRHAAAVVDAIGMDLVRVRGVWRVSDFDRGAAVDDDTDQPLTSEDVEGIERALLRNPSIPFESDLLPRMRTRRHFACSECGHALTLLDGKLVAAITAQLLDSGIFDMGVSWLRLSDLQRYARSNGR